jgi:hypothetical protein
MVGDAQDDELRIFCKADDIKALKIEERSEDFLKSASDKKLSRGALSRYFPSLHDHRNHQIIPVTVNTRQGISAYSPNDICDNSRNSQDLLPKSIAVVQLNNVYCSENIESLWIWPPSKVFDNR